MCQKCKKFVFCHVFAILPSMILYILVASNCQLIRLLANQDK